MDPNGLISEGWMRQFVAGEPRLSEAIELYSSLGLEVRLIPASVDLQQASCKACLDADSISYFAIYTRPKGTMSSTDLGDNG